MVKDREAWRASVHGVAKSQTRQQLNNNANSILANMLIPHLLICEFRVWISVEMPEVPLSSPLLRDQQHSLSLGEVCLCPKYSVHPANIE